MDRTNVEQIETTGMRYFDEENERWVKIRKIEDSIKVKGEEDYNVSYHWSQEGPLIQKSDSKSKIKEYIVKWHENEPKGQKTLLGANKLVKEPKLPSRSAFPLQ